MADKFDKFVDYLHEQLNNHSIYVWGGCGQISPTITESWIRRMENSTRNADRAIAKWNKEKSKGYESKLRAFDCSGLGSYFLLLEKKIPSKYNAQMMRMSCTKISRKDLKKGDWVFRVSNNNAYHIGYVVDDALNVIESKGRDDGVVKNHIDGWSKSYWNEYGRPDKWFKDLTESPVAQPNTSPIKPVTTPPAVPAPSVWSVSRILKKTSPYMKGEDVVNLQKALQARGYDIGSTGADGIFGTSAQRAVKLYQSKSKLVADGIAGKNTIISLGGKWIEGVGTPSTRFTISRVLKLTSPPMTGEDVKTIQNALKDAGYSPGVIDGQFGNNTKVAVINFQKYNGLLADGIVGEKTVIQLGGKWK